MIFGYCNRNSSYSIRRCGLLPHVYQGGPEKGFIEMSSTTFTFWYFMLIITKMKRWGH